MAEEREAVEIIPSGITVDSKNASACSRVGVGGSVWREGPERRGRVAGSEEQGYSVWYL